jgi:hypothetical protein
VRSIPASVMAVTMSTLEMRHAVWLERGTALGAALHGLVALLVRTPRSWNDPSIGSGIRTDA